MPRSSRPVTLVTDTTSAHRALVPPLGLEADWRARPRLWGHAFHPMCSYLASHPAALSHALLARWSRPGDVVLDPFSGRGTTPLQACVEGRVGVGNDLNPLAAVLTGAKVEPPTQAAVVTRITALRLAADRDLATWRALVDEAVAAPDRPVIPGQGVATAPNVLPVEVAIAFHRDTLAQVLAVRAAIDLADPTDRFIGAALAGVLHGRTAGYLSTLMPNTFSMAPRYVRHFAARTGHVPPRRDVFEALERKIDRLFRDPPPTTRGVALMGDARDLGTRLPPVLRQRGLPDRVRLVVTSPPYLRTVKYGYYNWLRMWLLGFDSHAVDRRLDDGHGPEAYLAFMAEVLGGLRPLLTDDAVVALVIGDVEMHRGHASDLGRGLAARVWSEAAAPAGYIAAGVATDEVAADRKMTKLWGAEAGRATKVDHILVLGATETARRRALAAARTPIDWSWPARGLRIV